MSQFLSGNDLPSQVDTFLKRENVKAILVAVRADVERIFFIYHKAYSGTDKHQCIRLFSVTPRARAWL
jgi:hypothetical protein